MPTRVVLAVVILGVLVAGCLRPTPQDRATDGRPDPAPAEHGPVVFHRGGLTLNATDAKAVAPNFTFLPSLPQERRHQAGSFQVDRSGNGYYVEPPTTSVPGLRPFQLWRIAPGGSSWTQVDLPPHLTLHRPLSWWTFHVDPLTDRLLLSSHDWAGHDLCGSFSWSDGGTIWITNPLVCNPPLGVMHRLFSGPAREAANPVYPSVLYVCANPLSDVCAFSLDGGAAWTAGWPVTSQGCGVSPSHVSRSDGVLYGIGSCRQGTYVAASLDHGLTWSSTQLGPEKDVRSEMHALTTDDEGNMYVARSTDRGGIELRTSRDHGATWSAPTAIHRPDVRVASGLSLAAGAPGRVAVSYWGLNGSIGIGTWSLHVAFVADAFEPEPTVATLRVGDGQGPTRIGHCNWHCTSQWAVEPTTGRLWLQYMEHCGHTCPAWGGVVQRGAGNWSGFVVESGTPFLRGEASSTPAASSLWSAAVGPTRPILRPR